MSSAAIFIGLLSSYLLWPAGGFQALSTTTATRSSCLSRKIDGLDSSGYSSERFTTESTQAFSRDISLTTASSNDRSESEDKEASAPSSSFDWFDQWYPVLPLSCFDNNTTKPIEMTILDHDLVVWKNSQGTLSVFENSCPHRKAPLSTGKLSNDGCNLACRYHGWEFDSKGMCAKIPMMSNDQKINPKGFRIMSYPTKKAGGMLWVYMNPSVKVLPPISKDALPSSEEEKSAMDMPIFFLNPISYNSMIENSFDPAHAPFTHEGMRDLESSGMYSPDGAIPIAKYELLKAVSASGFQVQHSPAYKTSKDDENVVITRTFTPPCTVSVHSPGVYTSKISFVPCKPGETMTIGYFAVPSMNIQKPKLVPKRLFDYLMDWFHFYFMASRSRIQFASQDRVNMQGQDVSKSRSGHWMDMATTVSDVGVSSMQKWARKFAGGGPFSLSAIKNQIHDENGKLLSSWDAHGKFCPTCQRSLQRLVSLEKTVKRISTVSFLVSSVGAIRALTTTGLGARLSLLFLVLSVGSRCFASRCEDIQDFFFASDKNRSIRMMNVYNS